MQPVPDPVYPVVVRVVAWLNANNSPNREQLGLRILKVAEEAGQAAAAWIGHVGQNPRKGITHTRDQVADELADVAITALVAIGSLGYDPAERMTARAKHINRRLRVRWWRRLRLRLRRSLTRTNLAN